MVDPPPWPDRPDNAQDFDEWWLVRSLPPQPFPAEDYDYGSDSRFGPPGTHWVFPTERLIDRETVIGTSAVTKAAIERLVRKLAIKLPPVGSMGWVTPLPGAPVAEPVGAPMRWILATVIGSIGQDESVAHTLKFRTAPAPDVDQGPADLLTFAGQVRDAWATWFMGNSGTGADVRTFFSPRLTYTEVRAAYLESDAPGHKDPATGKFIYPKPTYLVPTQYAPFAPGVTGTGTNELPYEVACCLSLQTGQRGARHRGRVYLGPLAQDFMGTQGNFDPAKSQALGASFALGFVHAINLASGNRLHVVSRMDNNSLGVNGVRTGIVPDSQRRRRRSRPESYGALVAT